MAARVGERDSGGPGDEFGRVGGPRRGEKLDVAKFHDAVERADRESVPLWPPAATRMTHSLVGRMLKQELNVVDTSGSRVNAVGVRGS